MAKEEPRAGTNAQAAGAPNIFGQLRDLTTDALRFWELRRLFYNALLAVIVAGGFFFPPPAPPGPRPVFWGFWFFFFFRPSQRAGFCPHPSGRVFLLFVGRWFPRG